MIESNQNCTMSLDWKRKYCT